MKRTSKKSHALGAGGPLASEHGRIGEEPLVADDFVLKIIEELEISFPQLEHGHVDYLPELSSAEKKDRLSRMKFDAPGSASTLTTTFTFTSTHD